MKLTRKQATDNTCHNLGKIAMGLMVDTFEEAVTLETGLNGVQATVEVDGMVGQLFISEGDGKFFITGGYDVPNRTKTIITGTETANCLDVIDAIIISIGRVSCGINKCLGYC